MAEIREHLSKAPLNEALVDLRTSVPEDFQGDRFLDLKETLAEEYPKVVVRQAMRADFRVAEGQVKATPLGVHGVFFTSEDDKQIAQFRVDGFTFSRLRPYTSWKEIFPEALRLWGHYAEIAGVNRVNYVSRIAVRYINRIDLAIPVGDFGDHLTVPPEIPSELSQTLSGFLTRVIIEDPETNNSAIVTQSLEKGVDDQSVSVILDIDAYRQGTFSDRASDLIPMFEELHSLKNRIFFGFITEQTAIGYE